MNMNGEQDYNNQVPSRKPNAQSHLLHMEPGFFNALFIMVKRYLLIQTTADAIIRTL